MDVRTADAACRHPLRVRGDRPLDRLADALSERARARLTRVLSDDVSRTQAAYGAPVDGAHPRRAVTTPAVVRTGEQRRGADGELLDACRETVEQARRFSHLDVPRFTPARAA